MDNLPAGPASSISIDDSVDEEGGVSGYLCYVKGSRSTTCFSTVTGLILPSATVYTTCKGVSSIMALDFSLFDSVIASHNIMYDAWPLVMNSSMSVREEKYADRK